MNTIQNNQMEEQFQDNFSQEMKDLVNDLISKSEVIYKKSHKGKNVTVLVGDLVLPIRVDDYQLFFIGSLLLPNIMNYLVNILPQFLYPYVVSYLQELSSMRDDAITISELFNYLNSLDHGNIFNNTQTEG